MAKLSTPANSLEERINPATADSTQQTCDDTTLSDTESILVVPETQGEDMTPLTPDLMDMLSTQSPSASQQTGKNDRGKQSK